MNVTVLSSGSSGNCYLLTHEGETLVVEQGISFKEVKKALNFNICGIVGYVCSHVHGDHHKYTHEYEKAGFKGYKPFEEQGIAYTDFGHFRVQAFAVPHDVPCYGFYIRVADERIVFVTDAMYVEPCFQSVKPTCLMVETNYMNELVREDERLRDRVYQTHMELQTAIDFIKSNRTDSLRNVMLMHLSNVSADADTILKKVKTEVGDSVNVYVAKKGLKVEL